MSDSFAYMDFKKGETFRAHISALGEPRKIHIVEVIDEKLSFCPMVVYRYYGKHKQYWHYFIDNAFSLTASIEMAK